MHLCVCFYLCVCRERCGVIKIRQPGVQRHWRERETVFQNGPAGLRRLTRKRYIDLGNEHTHCDRIQKSPNDKLTWSACWPNLPSQSISIKLYPRVNCTPEKLRGNVLYRDLQFDLFFFVCVCVFCPADEAGPGPVKSKYDALDFDTLLKEAQKSLHRWPHSAPDWPALVNCSNKPPTTRLCPQTGLSVPPHKATSQNVYIFTIGIK